MTLEQFDAAQKLIEQKFSLERQIKNLSEAKWGHSYTSDDWLNRMYGDTAINIISAAIEMELVDFDALKARIIEKVMLEKREIEEQLAAL